MVVSLEDIGSEVARGPCCPGTNATAWAWPSASSTTMTPSQVFTLPDDVVEVRLLSAGRGWTAPEDKARPVGGGSARGER